MTIKKIGFACKIIDRSDQVNGIKPKDDCKRYNTGSTTVAWLNRQTRATAEQKLWDLMRQNIEATRQLVKRVGDLDEQLRMVRISSDILPVYTEPSWSYFWKGHEVRDYCERHFAEVGAVARDRGVRLSFHPGQFTCLVSADPEIVKRSLEELEYHTDMVRWMGYAKSRLDFKINIHLSGRLGVDGFDAAWQQMSPELRNCLTLENDEYQAGIDQLLLLKNRVGIVLDIHHHFIREGEYISVTDDRVKYIIDSWAGVRPTFHYSQSREDVLIGHPRDIIPDINQLLSKGIKKQKLRAHSDFYWNSAVNDWALTHLSWGDLMAECKSKNLGSMELFNYWKGSTENVSFPDRQHNFHDVDLHI